MANMAREVDLTFPNLNHALVLVGITGDISHRARGSEGQVLPAFWGWIPRLVCLLTIGRTHLYTSVGPLAIQNPTQLVYETFYLNSSII